MEMDKGQLEAFLEKFWFAPQDALLRAFEASLWQKQPLKPLVFDIGCGDGRISSLLLKNRNIDVGIELEYRLAKEAKACGIYKSVLVSDARQLSIKSESLQTVISNSTFEHIDRDKTAIKEVAKVLTQNGSFIFSVPTKNLRIALKRLIRSQKRFRAINQRLAHFHYRSVGEWKKILENSGFKLENTREYFPSELVRPWFKLLSLATFKPYRRELWSYLKDSPYGKFVPAKFMRWLTQKYLLSYLQKNPKGKPCFVMIHARKHKSAIVT